MKFGKSAQEVVDEPSRAGSGGDFMRYIKDGPQSFRFLQEPNDWLRYWEHYNPMGFSFPCADPDMQDPASCPGCSSDLEKMKKPARRFAGNVLTSYNGIDYVNVLKVGTMVFDKLENRFDRFGTICDRDYTITRYKTSGDRYDFDVEGDPPTPLPQPVTSYQLKDVEQMLVDAYNDSWGEGAAKVEAPKPRSIVAAQEPPPFSQAPASNPKEAVAKIMPAAERSEPEPVYQEEDLRAMDYDDLVLLVKTDMDAAVPDEYTTTDAVVNWLMGA